MGRLIGYLKSKKTKGNIVRNPKVIKAVMFCDSNYAMNKETIKMVSGLAITFGDTLLTCSSDNKRTITLISTESGYVALSACSQ